MIMIVILFFDIYGQYFDQCLYVFGNQKKGIELW